MSKTEKQLESARAWFKNHPNYTKEWRAANPDKARAYNKTSRERIKNDPERLLAQQEKAKLYSIKNADKIKLRNQIARRTRSGVIRTLYDHQVHRSKERGMAAPDYTYEQLEEWVIEQDNFELFYLEWVESGYNKDYSISINRLNNLYGYSFDNIELVQWKEHIQITAKQAHKMVLRIDPENGDTKLYNSYKEAAEDVRGNSSGISRVTRGERKLHRGFMWIRYME